MIVAALHDRVAEQVAGAEQVARAWRDMTSVKNFPRHRREKSAWQTAQAMRTSKSKIEKKRQILPKQKLGNISRSVRF